MIRDYQKQIVDDLREAIRAGQKSICVQLPTGGGKTVIFSHICARVVERGRRALVLVHRDRLVEQTKRKLDAAGAQGVDVQMIQTAARRQLLENIDILIVDECHHARAKQWQQVIAGYQQAGAVVIGFTATPSRLDGKGLDDIFGHLISGPGVAWLMAQGHLSRARYLVPPTAITAPKRRTEFTQRELDEFGESRALVGDPVAHWKQHAPGFKTIAFCTSVKHCDALVAEFVAAGVAAATIHGGQSDNEREELMRRLECGDLSVLASCEILGEGVDVPDVSCVILARPTQSLCVHLQQVGRGLRPAPNKSRCIVLDHAGNCLRHGFAETAREWTLEGAAKMPQASLIVRRCLTCFCAWEGKSLECPECGAVLKPSKGKRAERDAVTGELVEVEALPTEREKFGKALADYAKAQGYKPGWVYHRFAEPRHAQPRKPGTYLARNGFGSWEVREVKPGQRCDTGEWVRLK